jgi:S-adenosylmethionine:tRNA ribosyltransferase-isomerase
MPKISKININDFNYELPKGRIAQYPLAARDSSKLLVFKGGNISEDIFSNIHNQIPGGSLLVFNDTKVIRARLLFKRETGSTIEIFCLEPSDPSEYSLSLGSTEPVEWKCLIGNQKKWKNRTLSTEFKIKDKLYLLSAERIAQEGDSFRIRFAWDSKVHTFSEVIEACGHIPLPPYIDRKDEESDAASYQTIYSMVKGSVAAPTAGMHFTNRYSKTFRRKVSPGPISPFMSEQELFNRLKPRPFRHTRCIQSILQLQRQQ